MLVWNYSKSSSIPKSLQEMHTDTDSPNLYKYQTPVKYPPVDNYHQVYKKVCLLLWTSVYLGNGTQNSLIELDLGSLEGDNWEKFAF